MTTLRFHCHRTNDLLWSQHHDPCDPVTMTQLVVLDPADLPHGYDDVRSLRHFADAMRHAATKSGLARDEMRANLLDYLADQIEQQTSPPVAEPVGDCVVRDRDGDLWKRNAKTGKWWLDDDESGLHWSSLREMHGPLTVLRPEAGA